MSAVFEGLPVKSVSIDNMLSQRSAVLERITEATRLLLEANEIAKAAGLGFPTVCVTSGYSRQVEYRLTGNYREGDDGAGLISSAVSAIDAGGWQHLMNESGMRSLMDAKARGEWDQSIEKGKFPAFTRENVMSTFEELHGSRGDIFERGVIEVFRHLSWSYKTNRPFAFGKRIVVTYLRGSVTGPGTSLGYVNSSHADYLDDLVRVLSVLDGKPEPDHRNGMYRAISAARTLADRDVDTEYLHVRCFRNGNGHVTFKRPDLTEKMNAILAKHYPGALPHDHHEGTS